MAAWDLATFGPLARRALRRRCPNCGDGRVWRGWLQSAERCPNCGLRLDRGEPDYFIGAYLLNLVVAELAVAIVFIALLIALWPDPPWDALMWGAAIAAAVAPLATYPFTKGLWLAVDLVFRPAGEEEGDGR